MNRLTVTRNFTNLAATILSYVTAAEARVVGLHIRTLRAARVHLQAEVVDAIRQQEKFEQDQRDRQFEIELIITRSRSALDEKKRANAAASYAAGVEIARFNGTI